MTDDVMANVMSRSKMDTKKVQGGIYEFDQEDEERDVYSMTAFWTKGMLWALNQYVLHPRGFSMSAVLDRNDGTVLGWQFHGDGTEPWAYDRATVAEIERKFNEFVLGHTPDGRDALDRAWHEQGRRIGRLMRDMRWLQRCMSEMEQAKLDDSRAWNEKYAWLEHCEEKLAKRYGPDNLYRMKSALVRLGLVSKT